MQLPREAALVGIVCILLCSIETVGAQRISPKIFNGDDAKPGRYPYLVSLRTPDNRQSHFCAGALIANDTVLTAAHCVDRRMRGFPDPILHIGRTCTNCDDEDDFLVANTDNVIIHPLWSGDLANGSDLAYIRLDRELDNAPLLRVRPQFNPEQFDWTTLYFAGWGLTGLEPGLPDTLQEAELPYLKPDDCAAKYEEFDFDLPAPEEKMCAGGKGVEACAGDSGGPLIRKGDTWEDDLGVGVLSGGSPGCGVRVELPALFTRLATYREFTREVLGIVSKRDRKKEKKNTRKKIKKKGKKSK